MSSVENENWILSASTFDDGSKKIFRVMSELPESIDIKQFDTCVIIEWLYEGDMPDENTNNGMQLLEKSLTSLDDPLKNSVMVHSITGNGMKEWCYYAKSYSVFIEELNNALSEFPNFPINIEFQEKTDWNYWEGILKLASEEA